MSLTVIAQRMGNTSFQRLVTGLVLSTLLVGCSSTKSSNVRVVDRNNSVAQRPTVTTGQYVVRPGDTLFSIAFRYGWDYKTLAARKQYSYAVYDPSGSDNSLRRAQRFNADSGGEQLQFFTFFVE